MAIWRCDTLPFSNSGSKSVRYGFLKDANFSPRPNFYKCILRLEFYAVVQFKDFRFFLVLISFFLAGRRLFSDVTH